MAPNPPSRSDPETVVYARDPLVLASASPRRRELLTELGRPFEVLVPDIEERPWPREMPCSYALRNAHEKARAIARRARAGSTIIAADTIVVQADHILEKPADAPHACAMLRRLSGAWHEVITGLCVLHGRCERGRAVRTAVKFRELGEDEISRYAATGEPMDKAGAYAIQGGASGFVEQVKGSYSNVVGLPLEALRDLLEPRAATRAGNP